MVFPTGYSTNLGLISGIMRPGDWIIADQNSHASIVDGAILSKANVRFFRHNNPADLEKKLKQTTGKKLVAIEGVYSMDGDVCPLPELVAVAKKYGARILLDEAHSAFVYGANGRGVAEHFGLEDEVDVHIGTFSKALGGQGGYVAGSRNLYNYLKGFARSRVFSCALSPVVTAGVLKSLELAQKEPQLRTQLWANVAHIRAKLDEAGVDIGQSTSQVIPIMVKNDRRVFELGHKLLRAGLYLQPIIYPAVAKHRSRFRVSISATHTIDQLDEGVAILVKVLREEGILV
jgi:glycine C-acetyltransferase